MDIRIEVVNLDAVIGGVDAYGKRVETGIVGLVNSAARNMRSTLAKYPPPPSGSGYRRTGQLGRAWMVKAGSPSGTRIVRTVYNPTVYAGWVEGMQQARVHQGRWPRVDDVLRSEANRVASLLGQVA